MQRYDYSCQQLNYFNDLFNEAIISKKIISINGMNFDVKSCKIIQSGCGLFYRKLFHNFFEKRQCKNIYSSINLTGNFYERNDKYNYRGDVLPYYIMCKCDTTIEKLHSLNFEKNLIVHCN